MRVRIRGPITFDGGKAMAQCYWCRRDVQLPIRLDPDFQLEGQTFTINR